MITSARQIGFLIIFLAGLLSNLHAQFQEVGLQRNPALTEKPNHKRSNHAKIINVFLPIGGNHTFCPSPEMLGSRTASIDYSTCQSQYQGTFEISDTCVTYQHTGLRTSDVICLEICDSNGMCEEYEIHFVSGPVLGLPFFDDFSTSRPYPDSARWLDRDVFINTTMAERPITIGVATFDGLDATGTPYGVKAGFSDHLTSAFIDLSSDSEVYFSFFVQPKGVGIKPRISDSLVVDFRDQYGHWVRVWQMEGLTNDDSVLDPAPDFAFNRWIIPDSFLHESFQFRFRNKSKNLGLQELWHIDYVRVGKDDQTREKFRDIAFRYLPTPILDPYSSMPAHQFQIKEVRRNIISHLNNLDQVGLTMNDPTYTIGWEGQTLLRRTFIEPVQSWLLLPGTTSFDFDMNDQGSTNYEALQSNLIGIIQPGEDFLVKSTLQFTRQDEILGARANNQVEHITPFSNYYAYDDGSAESAIIDRGAPGVRSTVVAMEFHNNTADQLQGVQLLIPHIEENTATQFFNLYVWIDSLDDQPEFTQTGIRVFHADTYFDTLQGFTTYDLRDSSNQKVSLPLPEGKFFIGWEQPDISGPKIPIGYDLNSPIGIQFLHFNVGQGWLKGIASGLRHGSFMLRPLLGSEGVIPTSTIDFSDWVDLVIYPNPTSGLIHFRRTDPNEPGMVSIYNLLGQAIYQLPLQESIDLSRLNAGTYLVKISNFNARKATSKLIQILK